MEAATTLHMLVDAEVAQVHARATATSTVGSAVAEVAAVVVVIPDVLHSVGDVESLLGGPCNY